MLAGLTATVLGTGCYGWWRFDAALDSAERRLAGRSALIRTRLGNLEFAVEGSGPPMMMIHGTGGGFDQGLRFSAALRALGHQIIAPSRFGYLRSDFPSEPSSENQADVLVELLDRLHVERVPVAGGSAGALSAAQFALRHPDRCSGLILLVPAANVRGDDPVEMNAFQEVMVRRLVASDFLYWSARALAPRRLMGTLLATDPALLDRVGPSERDRAFAILDDMLPIHARSRGMLNDGRLAGQPAQMDFSQIRVPTLLVSAEDDRFNTARTARELAAVIPGATLRILGDGGHIWLGHDVEVAGMMHEFLSSLPARRR